MGNLSQAPPRDSGGSLAISGVPQLVDTWPQSAFILMCVCVCVRPHLPFL